MGDSGRRRPADGRSGARQRHGEQASEGSLRLLRGERQQRTEIEVLPPGGSIEQHFALLAAHELRTPLTVLYGALQLLSRKPQLLEPQCRHLLDLALGEARDIQSLVSGLVDVARLQNGTMTLDLRLCDLNLVVGQAVERSRVMADDRDLRLHLNTEPLMTRVDALRVHQIIMSLLTNALEHAPDGEAVDVSVGSSRAGATVRVADHGKGLPSADPEAVFEMFAGHGRDVTPSRGGLGVGLYVGRQLARLHGGDLNADSSPGDGAVFTLRLPRVRSSLLD